MDIGTVATDDEKKVDNQLDSNEILNKLPDGLLRSTFEFFDESDYVSLAPVSNRFNKEWNSRSVQNSFEARKLEWKKEALEYMVANPQTKYAVPRAQSLTGTFLKALSKGKRNVALGLLIIDSESELNSINAREIGANKGVYVTGLLGICLDLVSQDMPQFINLAKDIMDRNVDPFRISTVRISTVSAFQIVKKLIDEGHFDKAMEFAERITDDLSKLRTAVRFHEKGQQAVGNY